MIKNWKIKDLYPEKSKHSDIDIEKFYTEIRSLKSNVDLPDLIIRLLYSRGVRDYSQVIKFFKPGLQKLYDPFLLKDSAIATNRIIQAIDNKEKLMILGDYDVDGTCGVSLFSLFLKHFGLEPLVYIPDRFIEGYGISNKAIDTAKENDIKLIISIDCGITAFDKVEYAKSKGIEFIICDHHQVQDKIPNALAVVNPLRKDCEYPFKYLCGTGVAFKIAQAISIRKNLPELPYSFLDFVAIATSADIVPIIDENRILTKNGLNLINNNPRPSFKILIETSGYKIGNINTGSIVFGIAPRINSVGRLGDAKRAVELLTCSDEDKLDEFVSVLQSENTNRREIDKSNTDDAYKIYEETINSEENYCIVLHNEKWHPGVIGIVAARLVEKYHLPTIVLTTVNGVAKGSARSINGFNIFEALKKCEDKLIQYGGHYHAAGLELEIEKIEEFRNSFNEIASKEIHEEFLTPEIEVDAEIFFNDISEKFIKVLSFFEPYGPGNMTPIFITRDVQVIGDVRIAKNNTLIFKVRDPETNKFFEAIYFNCGEFINLVKTGVICDICYSIEKSIWNGMERNKLRIRDIKIK